MAKRKCAGETLTGQPCKAAPLKGTDLCISHSPKDVQDSAGFGGSQPGAGRPRVPTHTEIARRLVEENIVAVQRPYWRALGFDVVIGENGPEVVSVDGGGAKLYGESKYGDICMTDHDDIEAMQKASERLQDRVFGRPKQATEISTPEGGPLAVIVPADQTSKSKKAAALLRDLGQLDGAA